MAHGYSGDDLDCAALNHCGVLTAFAENARELEAIDAGAVDYVLKDAIRGWDHICPTASGRCH